MTEVSLTLLRCYEVLSWGLLWAVLLGVAAGLILPEVREVWRAATKRLERRRRQLPRAVVVDRKNDAVTGRRNDDPPS